MYMKKLFVALICIVHISTVVLSIPALPLVLSLINELESLLLFPEKHEIGDGCETPSVPEANIPQSIGFQPLFNYGQLLHSFWAMLWMATMLNSMRHL